MPAPPTDAEFVIPDVNVLVALTNPSHQHHTQAHRWLSGVERFATTPITESGLVRLLLNPAVTGQQVGGAQAVGILQALRANAHATFLPDASSLAASQLDLVGLAGHKQATDYHLLNLAADHGGVLVTFDRRIVQSLTPTDQALVHVLS
ncbi:MAG: TA system VapC family ribonuclease toxin, partial [Nocardioidaceae bacterium]